MRGSVLLSSGRFKTRRLTYSSSAAAFEVGCWHLTDVLLSDDYVCSWMNSRRDLLVASLSACDPERKYGDDVYVTLIAAKRWGRSGAKRCDRLRRHDRCKHTEIRRRVASSHDLVRSAHWRT